jgi:hypothetical protein
MEFLLSIYWEYNNNIPTDEVRFFRGVGIPETTNQNQSDGFFRGKMGKGRWR